VLLGFGASLLWTAQGVYVTQAAANYAEAKNTETTASMGLFSGIFWSIFQVTTEPRQFLAFLEFFSLFLTSARVIAEPSDRQPAVRIHPPQSHWLAAALLCVHRRRGHCSRSVVFLTLSHAPTGGEEMYHFRSPPCVECRGHCMLWRATQSHAQCVFVLDLRCVVVFNSPFAAVSILKRLVEPMLLMKDPKLLLLIPLMILSGAEQGYISSVFTTHAISHQIGEQWVGYRIFDTNAFFFSVCTMFGSAQFGRILSNMFAKRFDYRDS
jgi:hypothetical protein